VIAIVLPLCKVDAPPVVIFALAAAEAPSLSAAVANEGYVDRVGELKKSSYIIV